MIARLWHGYTLPENADAYQQLLMTEILPGIHRVKGYQGCQLLRQNGASEVEFITVTMWDSFDSLREFAGEDYQHGVVPAKARKLLERFDESSSHYESIWCP